MSEPTADLKSNDLKASDLKAGDLKAGDRVIVRPDFILVADGLERDAIGIVEAVHPGTTGVTLVDVRFSPDRLDLGLKAAALERVPEREVTVGRSNHGLDG